ncbi:hypothetical protein ACFTZB_07710 [Rhodococcus sp. NPDC057014]|uniref:hypothetical protein n=1 Tax=Rhodococcus sp. NPDC057014 TaxID=3346000 RepID=UPI00362F987E
MLVVVITDYCQALHMSDEASTEGPGMNQQEIAKIAEEAAKPSYADVSAATGVILDALSNDVALSEHDAAVAVCQAVGAEVVLGGSIDVGMGGPDEVRNSQVVKYAKVLHATRLAIARLGAQGLIVAVNQSPPQSEYMLNCKFSSGSSMYSTSGPMMIPIGQVQIPSSFRLTPGMSAVGHVPLLTVEKWESDIEPLLNDRLRRILGECLDAARRGSYLSSVTLLGAVMEGAWYAVGEALRSHDAKLGAALDADRTAQVQALVSELLARGPRMKTLADDLQSFAGYVRLVRNYGIHPMAGDDAAAEDAFTEPGNFSLVQRAHSHLVSLLASARKIDPSVFP